MRERDTEYAIIIYMCESVSGNESKSCRDRWDTTI